MKKLVALSLVAASVAFAGPLDRMMVTTNANGAEITNNTITNDVTQEARGDENLITGGVLVQGADIVSSKVENNTKSLDTTSRTNGDENAVNNGTVIQ